MLTYRFKDIYSAYPNAKYILTTRNVNSWILSLRKQMDCSPKPRSRSIRFYMYVSQNAKRDPTNLCQAGRKDRDAAY